MLGIRRALFVCHYLQHVVGGAEIIGRKVVEGLVRRGWSIDMVVLAGPDPVKDGRTLEWKLPLGLKAGSLRGKQVAIYAGSIGIDAMASRQIFSQIKGESYDLVVAHDTVSAGLAKRLAEALRLPLVAFVYEPLPRLSPVESGASGWILRWLTQRSNRVIRTALALASHRIAASRDTCVRLEEFAPGPPSTVVYNSAPEPKLASFRGEGLLFVGRLSREKGFDLVVEAYRACSRRPRLSIASLDGPLAADAHRLAAEHEEVRLLPPARPEQMEAIYRDHRVVVAPSAWPDPLPGAVLEARAFGRALLVSRMGGIPEIIEGYRPVRTIEVQAGRARAVKELASAMDTMGAWADAEPDPQAEAAFRIRHGADTQIEAVYRVLAAQLTRG